MKIDLKIAGIAMSAIGLVASFIGDIIDEKQVEEMVDEKVNTALAKREES